MKKMKKCEFFRQQKRKNQKKKKNVRTFKQNEKKKKTKNCAKKCKNEKNEKLREEGVQTKKKWEPRGVGPEGGCLEGGGAEGGGANISRFFPLPSQISFFLLFGRIEPLALPWSAREPRPRQQEVSVPASKTSWAKASCCTPYRRMPEAAPNTLAGCILPGSARHPRGQYSA